MPAVVLSVLVADAMLLDGFDLVEAIFHSKSCLFSLIHSFHAFVSGGAFCLETPKTGD